MTATLNSIFSKSVPNGTKFVALYNDGSGARLFYVGKDGHIYDEENNDRGNAPDMYLMDGNFAYWIELPKSFELWFEQRNGSNG